MTSRFPVNKPCTRARAAAGARPHGRAASAAGPPGGAAPAPPARWDPKERLTTSLAAPQVEEQAQPHTRGHQRGPGAGPWLEGERAAGDLHTLRGHLVPRQERADSSTERFVSLIGGNLYESPLSPEYA